MEVRAGRATGRTAVETAIPIVNGIRIGTWVPISTREPKLEESSLKDYRPQAPRAEWGEDYILLHLWGRKVQEVECTE